MEAMEHTSEKDNELAQQPTTPEGASGVARKDAPEQVLAATSEGTPDDAPEQQPGASTPDDAARPLCAEEKALELASTAEGSEERKTRVTLLVTDDVDDYPQAVLRISSRIGNTNQYGAEWEQRLSVNRAFGNDFDF